MGVSFVVSVFLRKSDGGSGGDDLVNRESTSTLAHDGVRWRVATNARHPWRHMPPLGAASLHGK